MMRVRVCIRTAAGQLIQEASVRPAVRELAGDSIEIVGDTEDGRRVSVLVPVSLLEDVPALPGTVDLSEFGRRAEDRVLAAIIARAQSGGE